MAKTAKAHVTYTYKKHDYTFHFEYRYSFRHGFRAYIVHSIFWFCAERKSTNIPRQNEELTFKER